MAVECFEKASRAGHADATYYLAVCYKFGYGVSKSESTAASICLRAIDMGSSLAQSHKYTIKNTGHM